jgi:hypothetical protein
MRLFVPRNPITVPYHAGIMPPTETYTMSIHISGRFIKHRVLARNWLSLYGCRLLLVVLIVVIPDTIVFLKGDY